VPAPAGGVSGETGVVVAPAGGVAAGGVAAGGGVAGGVAAGAVVLAVASPNVKA
jgi:hypothetical protein